ncbi:hypothetical protein MC7420_5869 [Coleofasciculus chthonoplastes PCC 7420]|uniref:Uncharacterized protein n=1 Tax=Coleofasciculus chthonoplastes PCC 7420 TaxID=118168 RepID=B4VVN0_9CYAN|nr:hypothetical protein MC7420_5869 [Coleofasciculus chthonoplastes PCC 7420]
MHYPVPLLPMKPKLLYPLSSIRLLNLNPSPPAPLPPRGEGRIQGDLGYVFSVNNRE